MNLLWLAQLDIKQISALLDNDHSKILRKKQKTATWIVNLALELTKKKTIQLSILSYSSRINKDLMYEKNNLKIYFMRHAVPFTNKGYPYFFPIDKLTSYYLLKKKFYKYLEIIKPDLIHCHGTESAFGYLSTLTSIPSIISIQGVISEIYKHEPILSNKIQLKLEEDSIKKTTNFGCRNNWDKGFVKNLNPSAVVHYFPEALNTIFFNKKKNEYQLLENQIVFVGTIVKRKGIEVLIDSLKIISIDMPYIKLKIAGTGKPNYIKNLKEKINELGLNDNVVFLGNLNTEEISNLLVESDIFILPSFVENSPNSLCEAMALGVPTIASSVGGIPDLIENNKTGLLVEPGDSNKLSEKINSLLTNSSLRESIGIQALKVARSRHDPIYVAKFATDIYREILSEQIKHEK